MKKYQTPKFVLMVRQQAECNRFLRPIQLMQEGVYGKSYLTEGGEYSILSYNEGDLGEEFAALCYKAKIDRQSGHDLEEKTKDKIEVRFRRLAASTTDSGYSVTIEGLKFKTAEKLFVLVYNPVTDKLDGFEYNSYGERVTIRWSCRDNSYTEYGGKRNFVEIPSPIELFRSSIVGAIETENWTMVKKLGANFTVDEIKNLISLSDSKN
jgi:hypothetical protein